MKHQVGLLIAVALVATTLLLFNGENRSPVRVEFEKFKEVFDRQYTKSEETYRFAIFESNFEKIEAHNADPTQTYKVAINQFTDMTQEEFVGKSSLIQPRFLWISPA